LFNLIITLWLTEESEKEEEALAGGN